jgi:glycosyltransferase involved in cell wall biosynthesis
LVLTGASTGIGAATARRAVEFGYRAVLAARSVNRLEALADELGGDEKAIAVRCDVTSWEEQQALVERAVSAFGRMDVFFANAGFGAKRGFLEETWVARSGENATGGDQTADRYAGTRDAETSAILTADAVVTLSETMRADIVARGVSPERVTVVPNAVDVERFSPRPRDRVLGAELGLPDGEPVLGYVSTLTGYEDASAKTRLAAQGS